MNELRKQLWLRKNILQDVEDILEFQQKIMDGLSDQSLLRKNTREMFVQCVQLPNYSVGVYADMSQDIDEITCSDKKLVAIAVLYDGRGTSEDLADTLERFQVERAINLKLIAVAKEFRGLGIQRKLIGLLEQYAVSKGITHLCTTVAKNNIYSYQNVIAMGYEFDHESVKYGGLKRCTLVKRLERLDGMEKMLVKLEDGGEVLLGDSHSLFYNNY